MPLGIPSLNPADDSASDATALWEAFRHDSPPSHLALFTNSLSVDIAVARCCAMHPQDLPSPRFDAYVNVVKSHLNLWR